MPPHHRVVPNFGVTEFTKVFRSIPEKTEKTRGSRNGCTMVDIQTGPIIHDSFIYVSMGMYLQKGKIIRWLWSIKSTITRNGT